MTHVCSVCLCAMHFYILLLSFLSCVYARDYYIATSKYIPAAPDSIGKCTYTPPLSRWYCLSSWNYHPVSQTGQMATLNNMLYIADVPAYYYPQNDIAIINVSTSKVVGRNTNSFGYITNIIAWPLENSLLVMDGVAIPSSDGSNTKVYGTQAVWKWQPSLSMQLPQLVFNYSAFAPALNNTYTPYCFLTRSALIKGGSILAGTIGCVGGRAWLFLGNTTTGEFSVGLAFGVQFLNTLAGDINGQFLFSTDMTWTGQGYDYSLVVKPSENYLDGSSAKTLIPNLNTLCGFVNSIYGTFFMEDLHYDPQEDMVILSVGGYKKAKPFDRWHYLYYAPNVTRTAPSEIKCFYVDQFQGDYDMNVPVSVAF